MENTKKFRINEFLTNNAKYIVILIMIIYTGITRPNFLSLQTAMNVVSNASVRFIIALGVSGTLIIRGTDLSAGRVVGISANITGRLVQKPDYSAKFFPNLPDIPLIVSLIIVIVVCATVGILNGLVVSVLNVPPFLANQDHKSLFME